MSDEQERLAVAVATREDAGRLDERDRLRLAGWLSELSAPGPIPPAARRRRRWTLLLLSGSAAFLVPWSVYLAATLPQSHRAHAWAVAWVGFDVALVASFAATAWFGWRSRQVVITALVVTATLLVCDAWFDLTLSWGSREEAASIFTAVVAEMPIAVFLLTVYHSLLRSVTTQAWRDRGRAGDPPPLRRVPLLLGPGRAPHHLALHPRRPLADTAEP
jgi:hypothetical protein